MNKKGEKPLTLKPDGDEKPREKAAFGDILGDDDLTRFDNKKKKNARNPRLRPKKQIRIKRLCPEQSRHLNSVPRRRKRKILIRTPERSLRHRSHPRNEADMGCNSWRVDFVYFM